MSPVLERVMEQQEFEVLLNLIDQMISTSEPIGAEYYRGYRKGILLYQLGTIEESVKEHFRLHESHADNGDNYLNSYARGYRDGCKGLKPNP